MLKLVFETVSDINININIGLSSILAVTVKVISLLTFRIFLKLYTIYQEILKHNGHTNSTNTFEKKYSTQFKYGPNIKVT